MAHTEDMKRLIDGDGFVIGFEWQREYRHGHGDINTFHMDSFTKDPWEDGINIQNVSVMFERNIKFDSFEQGIKVDGEWWFDSDSIEFQVFEHTQRHIGKLRFCTHNYRWYISTTNNHGVGIAHELAGHEDMYFIKNLGRQEA